MPDLNDLFECLSSNNYQTNYAIAKSNLSCIMCGKEVGEFRNAAAKLEYEISALCQECQDACFCGK